MQIIKVFSFISIWVVNLITYNEETKIEICYHNREDPMLVFDAGELGFMHKDFDSDKDLSKFLVNAIEGDAIFCNKKINLKRISHFKAIRKNKSDKQATSYFVDRVFEEYDLVKIGVGMY